jgi:hypothetical protein
MHIRSIGRLAALAAACALAAPHDSGAATPEPVPGGGGQIRPVRLPIGLSRQPVTVVVQLSGDPVAVQQANAGRKLERAEREQIKAQLRGTQGSVHGNIQGLGGTVVANYQAAYNGIKVRIARDKVNQLAALPGVVAVRPVYPIRPNNVHGVQDWDMFLA